MKALSFETSLGWFTVHEGDGAIERIEFVRRKNADAKSPLLIEARRQITDYANGKRSDFDLPLHWKGTPFQEAVWKELVRIPFGRLRSYGEIAQRVGRPKAARAVGTAVGSNPLPLVVPCHRVIGSAGHIGGFGPGLPWKRKLLVREGSLDGLRPADRN